MKSASEPYVLAFEINALPRMTNGHSRRSTHWAVLAKEAQHWKDMVVKFVGNRKPPRPLTRARLTLIRYSSVSPDSDGLVSGFKHVIDGLVVAGVLANDRYENIGFPNYQHVKVPPKKGFIRVTVESTENEPD